MNQTKATTVTKSMAQYFENISALPSIGVVLSGPAVDVLFRSHGSTYLKMADSARVKWSSAQGFNNSSRADLALNWRSRTNVSD